MGSRGQQQQLLRGVASGRQLLGCSLAAAAAAAAAMAAPEAVCGGGETPRLGLKQFLRAARDEAAVASGLVPAAQYLLRGKRPPAFSRALLPATTVCLKLSSATLSRRASS